MNSDRLKKMAGNPNLIPGIYNYCDRWCERCPMTAKCLNYQMELEEKKEYGPEGAGMENERFWERMSENFDMAREMLGGWIEEEEGTDMDAVMDGDFDEFLEKQEEKDEIVRNHYLTRAAQDYVKLADEWFEDAQDIWIEKEGELQFVDRLNIKGRDPEAEAAELLESAEVVHFYQLFILVKTRRALSGLFDDPISMLKDMPKDHDGSAKIALIAIDRSIVAWTKFYHSFPEKEDEILKILIVLERLRRHLEETLPNARSFVRPGFDE